MVFQIQLIGCNQMFYIKIFHFFWLDLQNGYIQYNFNDA